MGTPMMRTTEPLISANSVIYRILSHCRAIVPILEASTTAFHPLTPPGTPLDPPYPIIPHRNFRTCDEYGSLALPLQPGATVAGPRSELKIPKRVYTNLIMDFLRLRRHRRLRIRKILIRPRACCHGGSPWSHVAVVGCRNR
jgi:hypothetical protein